MDKRGKFIVVDGGEGSGKSSVSKYVVSELKGAGMPILWTREPGGSPYAEMIRNVILAPEAKSADAEVMFALFWAARREHVVTTVVPALNRGEHVICDRFDSSTWAYQIFGQQQEQLKGLFFTIKQHYLKGMAPDHYVLFDVDPKIGLARAASRRGEELNHFDQRDVAFHTRIRAGFRDWAHTRPNATIVDASQPEEAVRAEALSIITSLLA